jgi:hypothetical protein
MGDPKGFFDLQRTMPSGKPLGSCINEKTAGQAHLRQQFTENRTTETACKEVRALRYFG